MDEVKFDPFQRVLVRHNDHRTWSINFYERKCGEKHKCLTPERWSQCIPYENNEHLLGTTDNPTPPEPEFKWGDKVEVRDKGTPWHKAIFVEKTLEGNYFVICYGGSSAFMFNQCRHADW